MVDAILRDVRYALRVLRKCPGFTAVAVLSLAIGIGANCAVFSFADGLLLRPLTIKRPDAMLTVGLSDPFGEALVASYRDYVDIRDRSQSFDGLMAFTRATVGFAAEPTAAPRVSLGVLVSDNFFNVVDLQPELGRDSRPEENYFDTIGIPILAGRGFRATDSADAPKVAVVNEVLAARYWPGHNPIGKRFRLYDSSGPWTEIVGVAKTSKYSFAIERPLEFVYLPVRQHPLQVMFLLAEAFGDPSSLVSPLREVVRGLDANMPIANVRTMEEQYRMRSVDVLGVVTATIGAMGLMGLALAIVGLYGLIAYAGSRRTREIGIRMAIGAARSDVLRMVLRQGLVLALAGLGVGLLAGAGVARGLSLAFPGGPHDGRTDFVAFAFVAVTVLTVTFVAAYVPARKASRINPTDALRHE